MKKNDLNGSILQALVFIIFFVTISCIGCARIEKRIMKEIPQVDKISQFTINYIKGIENPWQIRACFNESLCIDGQGETLSEAFESLSDLDIQFQEMKMIGLIFKMQTWAVV